jgi:hypothetical protein
MTIVRMHPVFYVNNLRPYPTATFRPHVPVTTLEDDDEYDLDRISIVKIYIARGRWGKYMLFDTLFKYEQIPSFWHWFNEV